MWDRIKSSLKYISQWSGKGVSLLTLIMALLMFTNAILSNVFQINFIALQESTTWLHAAVFMLGAAYTLQSNEHVRVDIFYRQYSAKTQAIVDIAGTLLFLFPVSLFILISSWRYVSLSWKLGEASAEVGGLPALYLLKSLVIVMPILLLIEGCHQIMNNIEKFQQAKHEESVS
ncbi:TRAP transporter small permease subunit [Pleionea sp. CnH1-48]|uniref:TRAP transporter small permease subunit n=1 Tax=Pleionea sp. CnH1-48 TaxID=2954494 RepID=UPI0020982A3B|nr:TRAP transporter small permease subunit [Pleionea sp. CnH1-48]MCO7227112.1 TRAP transporter small permease subunit [Pleionea sp. CnH1-48]